MEKAESREARLLARLGIFWVFFSLVVSLSSHF
jgi:hypothetical protein